MKNITVSKISILLLGLGAAGGCSDNPYTEKGTYVKEVPVAAPIEHVEYINAPDIVEFVEGQAGEIKIVAATSKGAPVVSVQNLPQGASFDPVAQKITWTPTHDDAFDRSSPFSTSRTHQIKLLLKDSEKENVILKERSMMITVNLIPSNFKVIKIADPLYYKEMIETTATYQIVDPDFPKGPFHMSPDMRMPVGTKILPVGNDPTRFELKLNPGALAVAQRDYNTCNETAQNVTPDDFCDAFPWALKVINPRGAVFIVQLDWKIVDARLNPIVMAPESINAAGINARFEIFAQDPNGEVSPAIKINPPETGVLLVKEIKNSATDANPMPNSSVRVDWVANPNSILNTTKAISFKVCVKGEKSAPDTLRCVDREMKVNF